MSDELEDSNFSNLMGTLLFFFEQICTNRAERQHKLKKTKVQIKRLFFISVSLYKFLLLSIVSHFQLTSNILNL